MKNIRRNPVARALRSPHLRKQVVADKKNQSDRKAARAQLKQGKYNKVYDLPLLFS